MIIGLWKHTDTTEPAPPMPQALYCGRSCCPHNRRAEGFDPFDR